MTTQFMCYNLVADGPIVLFKVGDSEMMLGTLRMRFRVAIEPVNRDRSAINSERHNSALAST